MADHRDDRIRGRAYAIWEGEGRPHGRHEEHWQQASQEFGRGGPPGEDGGGRSDPSARSLGSAAQSDLLPEDAGQGAERAGSLVDTGPAVGLAAGSAGAGGTGGGAAALGNLSLGQDVGHGTDEGSGEPGGMASIGSGAGSAGSPGPAGPGAAPAPKRRTSRKVGA